MKKIMRGVLLFGMLGGLVFACGQQKNNNANEEIQKEIVYKIGISQIVDHPALNDAKQGFKDALEKAGIVAEYDDKIANGDMSVQNLIMQQFVQDKKDLVFAITTPTAQTAKNHISEIPLVFSSVTDPEGAGLTNIKNITGTSGAASMIDNLKLMRKLFPEAKKLGIMYNSSEQNSAYEVNNLKNVAGEYGFEVVDKSVTNVSEISSTIEVLSKDIDVYYAIQDNTIASYFPKILDTLNEAKVPILASNNVYTGMGALVSQGTTDYSVGYRAGELAVEILKNGKNPSELPIELVRNLTIEVNEENLQLLGIELPEIDEEIKYVKTNK